MPKKFQDLYGKMTAEARKDVERRVKKSLKEMPLYELRAARRLTQQQLATSLGMTQSAISQAEHQSDLFLSTLENFVEAMGGRLEIYAVFRDGRVKLTQPFLDEQRDEPEVELEVELEEAGPPKPQRIRAHKKG